MAAYKSRKPGKGYQTSGASPGASSRTDQVQLNPDILNYLNSQQAPQDSSGRGLDSIPVQTPPNLVNPFVGPEKGWISRLFTGPGYTSNPTVEALNANIASQAILQKLLAPGDIQKAKSLKDLEVAGNIAQKKGEGEVEIQQGPAKAKNTALNAIAVKFGLTPEQAVAIEPHLKSSAKAQLQKETEEATTGAEKAAATRTTDVAGAKTASELNALGGTRRLGFEQNPANTKMLNAAEQAKILAPVGALVRATDLSATPGETIFRKGITPDISSLFTPGVVEGAKNELQMKPFTFKGKTEMFPQQTQTPGVFKPEGIKLDQRDIDAALQQSPQETPTVAQPANLGAQPTPNIGSLLTPPPGRSYPGRSSGGFPMSTDEFGPKMSDEEIQKLQQEYLRRLLQGMSAGPGGF